MTRRDAVIVGGGIIGGMVAWHLAQRGDRVTIVDRNGFGAACSHGNCGYVCPSHILPLPQPGAVGPALRALASRNSPFKIRPRFSPDLWRWLYQFWRRCNRKDMLEAAIARHGLLQSSMDLYREFLALAGIDCEWKELGLLFVFQSGKAFDHYSHTNELLTREFGVTAKPYDSQELVKLEPALKEGLAGGWHYPTDCHLRPDALMIGLRGQLESLGVRIVEQAEVRRFDVRGDSVRGVFAGQQRIEGDVFVVAAGAMTPWLNDAVGCRIPIQPGKGYSITMTRPSRCPAIPLILEEHRVAITPLRTSYRIGSTMEFAGYDTSLNPARLRLLHEGAQHYLHEPRGERVEEQWFGWRPMTWDGKPIIDRSPQLQNAWIAAGHNMLGLSMAPATGRLVSELIHGETPHLDPTPFRATRFS